MVASSPALAASCHQSHVKVIRFHGDDKFAINVIKVMCLQIYHCLGDDMVVIIVLTIRHDYHHSNHLLDEDTIVRKGDGAEEI